MTLYVNTCNQKFTTPLVDGAGKKRWLLWGDPVEVLDDSETPPLVRARGWTGRVNPAHLSPQGLLELYVIDVGQGDGLLMRTPDDRWHLVDGGESAANIMLGKGVPNFLAWKFLRDLGMPAITLENVILTHPDADHFGGLGTLFSRRLERSSFIDDLSFDLSVQNFYHNGMGRFAAAPRLGAVSPGTLAAPAPVPGSRIRKNADFITQLISSRADFSALLDQFGDDYRSFIEHALAAVPNFQRIAAADGWLPGYAPAPGKAAIRVLGPVVEDLAGGGQGLRWLSSEAWTRNGHSVLLRVDYGQARILLTGDLNRAAHNLLLGYLPPAELRADVLKTGHHGSDDFQPRFLQAVNPRVTVISSGDNESFDHPRPRAVGMAGNSGRWSLDVKGEPSPPLVYSTEIARSYEMDYAARTRVRLPDQSVETVPSYYSWLRLLKETDFRRTSRLAIAAELIYGLVNIRTDGEWILCATRSELTGGFNIEVIRAGEYAVE